MLWACISHHVLSVLIAMQTVIPTTLQERNDNHILRSLNYTKVTAVEVIDVKSKKLNQDLARLKNT